MSPFEYIVVLISIILGLGLTTLLTGLAEMLRKRSGPRMYLPHLLWIGVVFLLHLQDWWATYELRRLESWTLLQFLVVLAYPVALYLLAHLLFPKSFDAFDAREYFLKNYKILFRIVSLVALLAILANHFIEERPWSEQWVQISVVVITGGFSMVRIKSTLFHTLLGLTFLLGMMAILYAVRDLQVIR